MDMVDLRYFESMVEEAKEAISFYGPFDDFASEETEKKNHSSKIMTIDEVLDESDKYFSKNGDKNTVPF